MVFPVLFGPHLLLHSSCRCSSYIFPRKIFHRHSICNRCRGQPSFGWDFLLHWIWDLLSWNVSQHLGSSASLHVFPRQWKRFWDEARGCKRSYEGSNMIPPVVKSMMLISHMDTRLSMALATGDEDRERMTCVCFCLYLFYSFVWGLAFFVHVVHWSWLGDNDEHATTICICTGPMWLYFIFVLNSVYKWWIWRTWIAALTVKLVVQCEMKCA